MTAPAPPLDRLYRAHRSVVYAWLLHHVRRPDIAEDLTHNTYLRYARWAATNQWEDRGRPTLALLTTIARTALLDWRGSAYVRHEVTAGPVLGDSQRPLLAAYDPVAMEPAAWAVAAWHRRGWRKALAEAIADLTPRQQKALHLVYVEGLPHAEAAAELGSTAEAVRQIVFRAMTRLRRDPRLEGLADELDD